MNGLEEMELKEKKHDEFTTRFNISLAALSLAGVLTFSGVALHKSVDHLNSKCPFAVLYGKNIEEHHITEIKEEHPELIETKKVYKAPVGYIMENGVCYQVERNGLKTYVNPIVTNEIIIDNMTEEECKEQIRKLYK